MRLLSILLVAAPFLMACPSGHGTSDGGGGAGGGSTGGGGGSDGGFNGGLLPENFDAVGYAAMMHNGNLVVAGVGGRLDEPQPARRPDVFVARTTADLALDTTFAARGFLHRDFDGGGTLLFDDGAFAATADGDKIVVAGFVRAPVTSFAGSAVLARLNADGTFDESFNSRGYSVFDFNPGSGIDNVAAAYAVKRRNDGKYVVAGMVENGSVRGRDMFVIRVNADGSLDNAFSTGEPLHFGGSEAAYDIALQGDKPVVGGGVNFSICRLTENGMLDTSFGSGGSVQSAGGTLYKLLQRTDGRLLGIGLREVDVALPTNRVVLKLFQISPDGIPDSTFGPLGVVEIDGTNGSGPAGDIRGAALLPDGSLVLLTHNILGSRIFKITAAGAVDSSWGVGGVKPSGLRINLLSLILSLPRGANALAIDASHIYVTGSTLMDVRPGITETRFAVSKVGL